MKLSRYDVANRKVLGEVLYPHTTAEVMFPGTTFAVIHARPGQGGIDAESLAAAFKESVFKLDLATSAKKKGDFIITSEPVASTFWNTPEEAVGYGSVLLTPCWGAHPMSISLNVLVVEDGEDGTGDCHGKASPNVYAKLGGAEDRAAQFRLGVKAHGVLAKGTFVVDYSLVDDVDLILPKSAFKSSYKPEIGLHTWNDAVLGVVAWSKAIPTKMSWQFTQWFSKETVEADLLPGATLIAAQLVEAMSNTRALVELLSIDAKEIDMPFINIVRADEAGVLSNHPWIVAQVLRLLRQRWLDLAFGGGKRLTGLMGLPNDNLPFGMFATNDLPIGDYICTRYPLRYWGDIRVWKNVGGSSDLCGVAYMSHETAAALAGDFDGDYFQFIPVEDVPAMANEIPTWVNRPECKILKVKERKASPMSQLELARVMLENAESKVGIIALLIARANVANGLHAIPRLAQELQISVDKFKYNLEHDDWFLEMARDNLPHVAWLKDRDNDEAYRSRPMFVDDDEGTVGYLVQKINAFWSSRMDVKPAPLENYLNLLPKPDEQLLGVARELSVRYGRLVASALSIEDEDARNRAFSDIYNNLREWAEGRINPEEWAAALWAAVHTSKSNGNGSLPFHAFPMVIAEAVAKAEIPDSKKVAIVGMEYHDLAHLLKELDGQTLTLAFVPHVYNGQLRQAATIGGKTLGLVSGQSPVRLGARRYHLSWPQVGKAAVVYATVA